MEVRLASSKCCKSIFLTVLFNVDGPSSKVRHHQPEQAVSFLPLTASQLLSGDFACRVDALAIDQHAGARHVLSVSKRKYSKRNGAGLERACSSSFLPLKVAHDGSCLTPQVWASALCACFLSNSTERTTAKRNAPMTQPQQALSPSSNSLC